MKKLLLLFAFLPLAFTIGQSKASHFSLNANFLSIIWPTGFDEAKQRPGNFLLGGQYNYQFNNNFCLVGGLKVGWFELNGRNKDSVNQKLPNTHFEVLAAYPFLGIKYQFGKVDVFANFGYSIRGFQNQLGADKGWVLSGEPYTFIPLEIGGTWKLDNKWGLTVSLLKNFGDKLKVRSSDKEVDFFGVNFGISYAFLQSVPDEYEVELRKVQQVTKKLQREHSIAISEKDSMFEKYQICSKEKSHLIATLKAKEMELDQLKPKTEIVPDPIIRGLSREEINTNYNIRLGEEYPIRDFIRSNILTDDGQIILEEYNEAAFEEKVRFVFFFPSVRGNIFSKTLQSRFPHLIFRKYKGNGVKFDLETNN